MAGGLQCWWKLGAVVSMVCSECLPISVLGKGAAPLGATERKLVRQLVTMHLCFTLNTFQVL